MIPSIETIIEELLAGTITKQQAIGWLHQHAEGPVDDLRDHFAAHALQGLIAGRVAVNEGNAATCAYLYAAAMLEERSHGDQQK